VSDDGDIVISPMTGDTVQSWNLQNGERHRQTFQWTDRTKPAFKHSHGPILGRRGRMVVFPQPDGVVAIWDLDTGERRDLDADGDAEVMALAVSRDGRILVTCDTAGTIRVWDLAPGAEDREPRVLFRDRVARGAALSPDARRLALAFDDRLQLFDLASGQLVASADVDAGRAPSDQPCTLSFSFDGRFLAALSKAQSSLVLWNLATGESRRLDIGGHEVYVLAFSPDSSRVALAMSDRTVRVVDTATSQTRLLEGHRDMVLDVAWSRDSKRLASASYDRTIRLWDPDTGGGRVLRGHGASVEAVAFSPHHDILTSVSADGTARLWHLDRLPDDRAAAVAERLAEATTAVIGRSGRAATPPAWVAPAAQAPAR